MTNRSRLSTKSIFTALSLVLVTNLLSCDASVLPTGVTSPSRRSLSDFYHEGVEEWNKAWNGEQEDGPYPVFAKLLYPKSMEQKSQLRRRTETDAGDHSEESGTADDHGEEGGTTDGHGGEGEHSSTHIAYEEKFRSLVFLMAIFFSGKVFEMIGMPSLVGEIICGFLLGPPLADFAPLPSAWLLVGEIGLYLLMVEAGVEIDLAMLKLTGVRAFAIGLTGSCLPLGIGTAMGLSQGLDVKQAITLGCCFAPTSLAVASGALKSGNAYNTPVGQLIVASCVIDDVIGLILLSVVKVLALPDPVVFDYILPVLSSFGLLILLGGSAITWLPKVFEGRILPLFPEKSRDIVAFGLMMGFVLAYIPLLNISKASDLTGAFLAGMTFSQVHSTHHVFVHQTKQVMKWMMRIFFAAVIGFAVPIKDLFAAHILKMGFFYYILVLTKLPVGLYTPHFQKLVPPGFPFNPFIRDVLITGVGMTCRGEMSFIIGSSALQLGIFDDDLYAAMVVGVLVSSITSPFFLLGVIKFFNHKQDTYIKSHHPSSGNSQLPLFLVIQTRTGISWGLQHKLRQCLGELGLVIIDHRHWHPREIDSIMATEIFVQDTRVHIPVHDGATDRVEDVTEEDKEAHDRIREIKSSLFIEIGQEDAVVEVQQWHPHAIEDSTHHPGKEFSELSKVEQDELLAAEAEKMIDADQTAGMRRRRSSVSSVKTKPPKFSNKSDCLWRNDQHTQSASRRSVHNMAPFEEAPDIQGRLAGTVRKQH